MSDNISSEEIKRRLVIFLRIPTEVWTDVLKLFPRRTLVQKISPVCYRLKEISNKNVKTVHVIKSAHQFTNKLEVDDPDAIEQLEQLAANKCKLSGQFQLTKLYVSSVNVRSQDVLRHSLDLLQGCQLTFDANGLSANGQMALLDDCLTCLESTKPNTITIAQKKFGVCRDPADAYWPNPTVQKCDRVVLNLWPTPELMTNINITKLMKTFLAISHWLHHRPMDCNNCSAADQVRCMIVLSADFHHIDWLLDVCSKNIQKARKPSDRRSFVLSFKLDYKVPHWPGFDQFRRIENKTTGEVLMLDRVIDGEYRLRRCLAEEEANGQDFYAGMFKQDDELAYEGFNNIGEEATTAQVIIGREERSGEEEGTGGWGYGQVMRSMRTSCALITICCLFSLPPIVCVTFIIYAFRYVLN